ncbi:MAG TPA: serine/threonine-protein kinase, partial [Polyangiales bacterium]|nr:serine/threonine-protein kinase [Polyangiales bacterium]
MDPRIWSSEPPADTAPPSRLPSRGPQERYELNGTLGRGGVAVVHAATDLVSGHKVALKRLRAQDDPALQQRVVELFEREFHTLSQLEHPNIVTVHDYGIDAEGPYYTMELVEGGDLQQLAPLPWRKVCAIARDVCSALSLLHSRRLVHRDISPRNVRCDHEGRAKLLDFGALAPFGANKFLVGTPACCAPESVNLQPLDGRADLYGLG